MNQGIETTGRLQTNLAFAGSSRQNLFIFFWKIRRSVHVFAVDLHRELNNATAAAQKKQQNKSGLATVHWYSLSESTQRRRVAPPGAIDHGRDEAKQQKSNAGSKVPPLPLIEPKLYR